MPVWYRPLVCHMFTVNELFFCRLSCGHSGATLQHTQTRRPPNCFNFLRQVEIIERSGGAGVTQQMEDYLLLFLIRGSPGPATLIVLCERNSTVNQMFVRR